MKILILNFILYTADNNIIPKVKSIKDTMIYNMCLGFKQLGNDVTLGAAEDFRPTEKEDYDFNVVFFKTDYKRIFPPSVLPYSRQLKKYLLRNRECFDLIISSEVFSFVSLCATRICPQKTIIWQELTQHQNKFYKLPSKLWHNWVARLYMKKIKTVVPRSESAYRFIKRYMPQTVYTVVDHGINVQKFSVGVDKQQQIISSSQLIYRKNVDGIIRIFSAFHKEKGYEDIKLLIAGRGEEEENLKRLVAQLNLQDSVVFLGFLSQSELNRYVKESYCFLVNTRQDLNMVSIPESIVSGTPILTNFQPASAGYIQREQLGIVKDQWGVKELKEIINNNSFYVSNCIKYRDKLTNFHSAQMLIDIFNHKR